MGLLLSSEAYLNLIKQSKQEIFKSSRAEQINIRQAVEIQAPGASKMRLQPSSQQVFVFAFIFS